MGNENTQETVSQEEEISQEQPVNEVNTQQEVTPEQPVQNQNTRSSRESRRENQANLEKRWKDAEAWGTRNAQEAAELKRKISEMEQRYAPLDPYREKIKEFAEKQKQAELAQLMKTDPVAAQKLIAEEVLKQQMAPLQQQMQQQEQMRQQLAAQQENTRLISYLQTTLGDEKYKQLEPSMAEIITAARQTNPQYEAVLKQNPNILYHLAYSINAHRQQSQVAQQKQVGQQNQQVAKSFATSNLKSTKSTQRNNSNNASDKALYDAYKKAIEQEGFGS